MSKARPLTLDDLDAFETNVKFFQVTSRETILEFTARVRATLESADQRTVDVYREALEEVAQFEGGVWAHRCMLACTCPRAIARRALR